MTTPRQATARCSELYVDYCPLLDQLVAATPDNVDTIVAEEQRLAKKIWTLGYIAFGLNRGATLEMLKHDYDEVEEIHNVDWLNEAHRKALIGCCVRSKRLKKLLDESEPVRKTGPKKKNMGKQIAFARELIKTSVTDSDREAGRLAVDKFGIGDCASVEAADEYVRKRI